MLRAIWEGVWLLLGMALTLAMEWAVAPSTMSRMAQHYDLDLGWLWWLFSLDLDRTPSTVSRNNKWQIYTKGLLAWAVTDTVAYAFIDYCNLKHTTWYWMCPLSQSSCCTSLTVMQRPPLTGTLVPHEGRAAIGVWKGNPWVSSSPRIRLIGNGSHIQG